MTLPSTNRARRRLTSLIKTNAQPLRQTTTVVMEVVVDSTCVALVQDDYSQVESMAADKQKELESLSEELTDVRASYASPELQVLVLTEFICMQ